MRHPSPSLFHCCAAGLLGALLALAIAPSPALAQAAPDTTLQREIDRRVEAVTAKVVAWRRDVHQHPELSNREVRTAKVVAEHLRALGLEVRTGVARTGVVGVLRGGRPGPVVALRADMDALPVTEEVSVPFASKVTAEYNGQKVGVMHACGHDAHTAMLMGAAEVLAGMRAQLPGTVVFLFQPAEEQPPPGEEGGADVMVAEGALDRPKVDAIFGLHVLPIPLGQIQWRAGGIMASSDRLEIRVHGRQTHGAQPWEGVDTVVVASQIVAALQTITSRQMNLTTAPVVVSIGRIQGGVRYNIIPDKVLLEGTIRALDEGMRRDMHARIRRTVEHVAQASGAKAEVVIERATDVTYNDPALVEQMLPTLERVAGKSIQQALPATTAEDFSEYQKKVPGMFFFLGITPPGTEPVVNHSPRFVVDEAAMPVGVRALVHLAVDYLTRSQPGRVKDRRSGR
ncbi:MAG TPA: amidohydrolase [Haliangium sp.]|nr:amidohydrolase [Haliangium sp.]